jgi:SRSO17 transposase
VIHDVPTNAWDLELEELFLRTGARFCRVEARRRMRGYVRGLLGPVGRKNSWQLTEYAGHATPHGLQHLLSHSRWDTDGLRDDLQAYVVEQLGQTGGVLILDDTGFVKKGTTSPVPAAAGTTDGPTGSPHRHVHGPPSAAARTGPPAGR